MNDTVQLRALEIVVRVWSHAFSTFKAKLSEDWLSLCYVALCEGMCFVMAHCVLLCMNYSVISVISVSVVLKDTEEKKNVHILLSHD